VAVDHYKAYRYQLTLRALGAWLDEAHPQYFTIFETPDGLSVSVTLPGREPIIQDAHFPFSALAAQWEELPRKRGTIVPPDDCASLFPTGRQDFLHALGFELDQAGAESLVIDHYDDTILLSYAYVDPGADFSWHKRMATLNPDEIAMITKVARSRRRRVEEKTSFLSGFRRQKRPE
jgi:hypothetical protein